MNNAQLIRESWEANAANWLATLDNNEIESRCVATNEAIVQQVLALSPKKVLDLGCGEGWLSRALRKQGIEVWGTDAAKELIDAAIERDGHFYFRYSYEEIISGKHELPAPFAAVVINFALLDKEVTEALIGYLPQLLKEEGCLVIQTLHPLTIAATEAYVSGWKKGTWTGLKQPFTHAYQWYFRTTEDWFRIFRNAGFVLERLREPIHPQTQKPLSLIFTMKAVATNFFS